MHKESEASSVSESEESLSEEDIVEDGEVESVLMPQKRVRIASMKDSLDGVVAHLMAIGNKCMHTADHHKLPSATQASLWTTLHRLRSDKHLLQMWNAFTSILPVSLHESHLCFNPTYY